MTESQIKELKEIVNHQANMESLWAMPIYKQPTIMESLLCAALRHLHAVIEGDGRFAAHVKEQYWNLESEI